MAKKKPTEEIPIPVQVELEPEVKQQLGNIESVVGGTYSDLDELGKSIDAMQETTEGTAEAIKKLTKQYIKDRKAQEEFNTKISFIISTEVAKQLKPLVKQLNNLAKNKPKFIWVLPSFPTAGIWSKIKSQFIKQKGR